MRESVVTCYHAFDLQQNSETVADVYSRRELTEEQITWLSGPIAEACTALAALLGPSGTGVVCGLFTGLRQAGLGVDWSSTFFNPAQNDKHYIFVRHGIPHLGTSAWEDTRAFIVSGSYFGRTIELDERLTESYSELFRQGETLEELRFLYNSGGETRVRLIRDCGLLLLEESTTKGFRHGLLNSMSAIFDLHTDVGRKAQAWPGDVGRLTKNEIAPRLTKYLEAL